jgi:hypothetical protein
VKVALKSNDHSPVATPKIPLIRRRFFETFAGHEWQARQGCEDDDRDPLTGVNGWPRHTPG